MRVAFGLVGLLVAVGVIVYILGGDGGILDKTQADLEAGERAKQQVRQMAGSATDGSMRFSESLSIDMDTVGGRADNIIVTNVVPGGPAESKYSLQRGDAIIQVGPLRVRDQGWDSGTAMDFLTDAYQRNSELIIRRSGEELTLNPGEIGSATGAAPTPAASNNDAGNPLHRQLDAIQRIPTH